MNQTTSKPLTATDETFAVGVAMTPAVIREGVLKARCVPKTLNPTVVVVKSAQDGA